MRFMVGKFNEELVKAGVMLTGEGLRPSSSGARVKKSPSPFPGEDCEIEIRQLHEAEDFQ